MIFFNYFLPSSRCIWKLTLYRKLILKWMNWAGLYKFFTWISAEGKIMSGHQWKLLAQLWFSGTFSSPKLSHFIRKSVTLSKCIKGGFMVVLLQVLLNCTDTVPGATRDGICLEHGICKTSEVISEVLFLILVMICLHIINIRLGLWGVFCGFCCWCFCGLLCFSCK